MQELSLNVLDIAQNSVAAGATLIEISIDINISDKKLTIKVADNGKGMSEEVIRRVSDPFYTTRTTRKVGLGIPFFKMSAEITGGDLFLESTVSVGTTITAVFTLFHIDLMPLGDMASTIGSLIQCNPNIDFIYTVAVSDIVTASDNITENNETFTLDTKELRLILGDVSFENAEVAVFIREYLEENSNHIIERSTL